MATTANRPKAPPNALYEIRPSPKKGYGCFALHALPRGTRILADPPLLAVPTAHYLKSDIEALFAALAPASQALYLSLHSTHAQDPRYFPLLSTSSMSPRLRQHNIEQHEARCGPTTSLVSIFQTNCMELGRGAAIFAHAARFNHCCNPNACFTYNTAIERETIHLMHDVGRGEEITLSYCDMACDKGARRFALSFYGIVCDCKACEGDEMDVCSFASLSAERRFRIMELEADMGGLRREKLDEGARTSGFFGGLFKLAALHLEEGDRTERLASVYLDIAYVAELQGDMILADAAATTAVEIKRDCQGSDSPNLVTYDAAQKRISEKLKVQQIMAK